ncbi:hypothetical protein RZS08_56910, partial [Arthrospira platensis SPKY1]|nr:hypothetical protein [Arthrospira platensis SPKY1]
STANCRNDQLIRQIETAHQANTELIAETAAKMDTLVQLRNRINIQGRALTTEEIEKVEAINQLEQRWLAAKDFLPPIDSLPKTQKGKKAALQKQETYRNGLL